MMSKVYLFSIAAIFVAATNTNAQTKEDTPAKANDKAANYIAISGGASFATGNFASTDTGILNHWNNDAGFGKDGFTAGIEGAYYPGKYFGIVGTVNFAEHGKLSAEDAQKLGDSYTDAFAVDESTVSTTKTYSALTVLAGPQLSFPLSKLTLDFRVMGGLLQSLSTPEITVRLEDQTDATFTQKSATSSAFAWQAGAGFRYAFTNKIGVILRGDYVESDGIKIDNTNRSNNAGRLVTKQEMSWFNTTIGLAYSF